MNPASPASGVLDCLAIGLDALDMTETLQGIKEQARSASHIENSGARCAAQDLTDFLQQNLFPNAPPPMLAIQASVGGRIFRVHQLALMIFATTYGGRPFASP